MADDPKLIVALEARLDKFQKDLRQAGVIAEREADKISGAFTGAFGTAGAFIKGFLGAFSAGQLISGLRDIVQTVGDIADAAQRVAVSTDAIQALRFEMGQAGLSAGAVDSAMQRFANNVGKAADGTSHLARIFAANNVAMKDAEGRLKSQEQLLNDFARLVANAATEQDKIRLSTVAFGSAGARMVETLEKIATQGLPAFIDGAKAAGLVIDKDMVAKAEQFDKAWDRALTQTSVRLKSWAIGAIVAMEDVQNKIDTIEVKKGQSVLGALFDRVTESGKAAEDRIERGREALIEFGREAARAKAFTGLPGKPETVIPPTREPRPAKERKGDLQRQEESLSKIVALSRSELLTVGMTVAKQEEKRQITLLEEAARREGLALEQAITQQMRDQAATAGALKQQLVERQAAWSEMVSASRELGSIMSDAMKGMVLEGKKFDEVLKNIGNRLASKAFDKLFDALFAAPSGGGGSAFMKLIGLAGGGPVAAGRPYMVGERGPELFVPGRSGQIVPNTALKGSGGSGMNVTGPTTNVVVQGSADERTIGMMQQMLAARDRRFVADVAHATAELRRRSAFA